MNKKWWKRNEQVIWITLLAALLVFLSVLVSRGATIPDAVAAQRPNVVRVEIPHPYGAATAVSGGSGVYLADGRVLTCWHLRRGTADWSPYVNFPNGDQIKARWGTSSEQYDVGLLVLDRKPRGAGGAELALQPMTPGQTVYLLGYPGRCAQARYRVGRCKPQHYGSVAGGGSLRGVDVPVEDGFSGGPVMTAGGRVIGPISASNHATHTILAGLSYVQRFIRGST